MDAREYQELAMATEADQALIHSRLFNAGVIENYKMIRLDTAVRGLAGDVGEVCTCIQKWIEYGQSLDEVNLKEEVGDCLWRLAQICKGLGITLEDAMIANIEKLKIRYPDKYSDEKAAEENRDRKSEREVLSKEIDALNHLSDLAGGRRDLAGANLESSENPMSDEQREFAKEFIGVPEKSQDREAKKVVLERDVERVSIDGVKSIMVPDGPLRDLAGANLEQTGQGWEEEPSTAEDMIRDQIENRYDDPGYPHKCVFCKAKVYKGSERKICPSCTSKLNHAEIK